MNILPRYNEAVIPLEKFTEYCLNSEENQDKATAFNEALGDKNNGRDNSIQKEESKKVIHRQLKNSAKKGNKRKR